MRSLVKFLVVTSVLLASLAVGGCQKESVVLSSDPRLEQALQQRLDADGAVPLASLTDFAWDEFGFVPEGTPARTLESVFGSRIIRDDRYTSSPNLFVFRKEGTVVKAVMVALDRFDAADAGRLYPASVTVARDAARPTLLRFR